MTDKPDTDIMSWIRRHCATHRLEDGPACEDYSGAQDAAWTATAFALDQETANALARAWRGSERRGAYRVS